MSYELSILINTAINPTTKMPMPIHPMEGHLWTGPRANYAKKVPDHLVKYTNLRGPFLAPYLKGLAPNERSIQLKSLLASYPESSAVPKSQIWTEKDHEHFKEALTWYDSQGHNLFGAVLTHKAAGLGFP